VYCKIIRNYKEYILCKANCYLKIEKKKLRNYFSYH